MNKYRALIYSVLNSLYPTYANDADCDANIDYITYYISETEFYAGRDDINLELSCWSTDRATAENMVQTIKDKLNYQSFESADCIVTFYMNTTGVVDETDKTIQHRTMRFNVSGYLK